MKLVTNLTNSDNHLARVHDLASRADGMIVLSPFLARDLAGLVSSLPLKRLREFRLITTLQRDGNMQLDWARALKSLRQHFSEKRHDVFWSVATSNELHGKVYVFLEAARPYAVIVTSANFTQKGLRTNQEWGVEIRDNAFIKTVMRSILAMSTEELTAEQIDRLHQSAEELLAPSASRLDPSLHLPSLLPHAEGSRTSTTVWIKPSGVSEDPVRPKDLRYASDNVELRFTIRRPSGVQIGDKVVVYGVGDGRLLGLFEVDGPPRHASPSEIEEHGYKKRWPWHVTAKNLALRYSQRWWNFNLDRKDLEREYVRRYPAAPLTAVGGYTLGALSHGQDKVALAPQFAAYLMDRIWLTEASLQQVS